MKTPEQIFEFFDAWCETALLSTRPGDPHAAGMAAGALLTLAAIVGDETAHARVRAILDAIRNLKGPVTRRNA